VTVERPELTTVRCYRCQKKGHYASSCPKRSGDKYVAALAQTYGANAAAGVYSDESENETDEHENESETRYATDEGRYDGDNEGPRIALENKEPEYGETP
jgi:hypothetical protein